MSGLPLDAAAKLYPGAPVTLNLPNAGSAFIFNHSVNGTGSFVNVASGLCIDALGGAGQTSPLLMLNTCGARPAAQRFSFDPPSATLRLFSNPAMCVTVEAAGDGSPLLLAACPRPGSPWVPASQNVTMRPNGTLLFATGSFLDAGNQNFAGASVGTLSFPAFTSTWTFSCGSGELANMASGLCLDAGGVPQAHACLSNELRKLPFCQPAVPLENRVQDLVSRLTLAEKIGLTGSGPAADTCDCMDSGVPRLGIPPHQWLVETNSMVASACYNDSTCATSFPSALNLGAAFNRTLWRAKGEVVSTELRAFNNLNWKRDDGNPIGLIGLSGFGPDINQPRDPRNGRSGELVSEDPYLTGQYAIQYVRGCQEGDDPQGRLKMITGLKHYAAYSLESGRFTSTANISMFDLWDTYLPAFEAGFVEGGASGSMCSYVSLSLNGTGPFVPACANLYILDTVVRQYWGRPDAMHTSDCGAVQNMAGTYVSNYTEAAAVSINAGMDLNTNTILPDNLADAIKLGITTEAAVDIAVSRTLRKRFQAGQFDPLEDQVYTTYGMEHVATPEHLGAAYEAAAQGLVLLKNGDGALPLEPGIRVAVLGPIAVYPEAMMGDYYADQVCPDAASRTSAGSFYCVPTIAEAITGANIGGSVVTFPGVGMTGNDSSWVNALDAVDSSDAVILALGIDQQTCGEGTDRTDIGLPGLQTAFALAVSIRAAAGKKPVILVLINGLPLAIDELVGPMDAIVEAYTPSFGAAAIGAAIFGANRWGRGVYTMYPHKYQDEVSLYDFSMTKAPGRTYKFYTGAPLFRFGAGLTYSSVELQCVGGYAAPGADAIGVNCTLSHLGGPAGDQVLMVYHRASAAVIGGIDGAHPVPQSALVEFQRVSLGAGGTRLAVFFQLSAARALSLVDGLGASVLYPGLHYLDVWDGAFNNVSIPFEVAGGGRDGAPIVLRRPPLLPLAPVAAPAPSQLKLPVPPF